MWQLTAGSARLHISVLACTPNWQEKIWKFKHIYTIENIYIYLHISDLHALHSAELLFPVIKFVTVAEQASAMLQRIRLQTQNGAMSAVSASYVGHRSLQAFLSDVGSEIWDLTASKSADGPAGIGVWALQTAILIAVPQADRCLAQKWLRSFISSLRNESPRLLNDFPGENSCSVKVISIRRRWLAVTLRKLIRLYIVILWAKGQDSHQRLE